MYESMEMMTVYELTRTRLLFLLLLSAPLHIVISQLTTSTVPSTCSSDLDCCLLGSCVNSVCVCDPGFTGPNCQTLDLLPASDPNIEGYDDPLHPAWGGKAIWADGKWNFIVSYMRTRCYITSYGTNSAYLRAVGDYPWGPFQYVEEVLPPFHHGAQVERNVNKQFLIFGDGMNMPESTVHTNCQSANGRRLEDMDNQESEVRNLREKSGRNRGPPRVGNSGGLYPFGDSPNDVHMVAYSDSISGPWTQHQITELQTNIQEWDKWDCNKTNLAPVILPNGTVVIAFRSISCLTTQQAGCGNYCQHIGIAVSNRGIMGPYTMRPNPLSGLDGNEDPFLFQNKRGWILVMHGKNICGQSQTGRNTCGSLAYSPDSYTWYLSPFPTYDATVTFDASLNIPPEELLYRQRPKILFSTEGVPLVLYNGGQRYTDKYIRNFAFRFNVPDMSNYQTPPKCPPANFVNQCTEFTRQGYTYQTDELGCEMIAKNKNCVWCPEYKQCRPALDPRICSASSIATFYAWC